jgi:hypothetical protein
MKEKEEVAVQTFFEYWGRRTSRGEVSGLSLLERSAIRIFAEWLFRHYRVTTK